MCTSVDPLLGLGSSLVLQGNSNVTLLNHRITLGTKGWLTFLTAAAINMFAEFNVHVYYYLIISCRVEHHVAIFQWWPRMTSSCRRSSSRVGVHLICEKGSGSRSFCHTLAKKFEFFFLFYYISKTLLTQKINFLPCLLAYEIINNGNKRRRPTFRPKSTPSSKRST
jgi:hypothetical protein